MAALIGNLFGPLIGFYIYHAFDDNFRNSLLCISIILFSGTVLFFLVFSVFFPKNDIIEQIKEEEVEAILEDQEDSKKNLQMSISAMIKFIWQNKDLRNFVLGVNLIFSVYTTEMVVTVFYLETSWSVGGLGLSDQEVSYLTFFTFIPVIVLVLILPKITPKYVTYFSLYKIIIIPHIVFFMLIPVLRDAFVTFEKNHRFVLIYFVISTFMIFNPNLISPFVNYYLNIKVPKNGRTTFNSINFLLWAIFVILIYVTILPFFSVTMFDPRFVALQPYNKYICFVLYGVILVAGIVYMKKPKLANIVL